MTLRSDAKAAAWAVWYGIVYGQSLFWGATASTLSFGIGRGLYTGNWKTAQTGLKMVDFGVRAHANMVRGVLNTPLSRARPLTLGQASVNFASGVAAGYAVGAVVGTGISYAAWGDEGAVLAADLYAPGGASIVTDGIMAIPENFSTIVRHYT